MSTSIRNVIFDLGGVLIIQDTDAAFASCAAAMGKPEQSLRQHFFGYFNAAATDRTLKPENYHESGSGGIQECLTADEWADLLKAVYGSEKLNEGLAGWMKSRPQYRYFVLTNNTAGIDKVLDEKFGLGGVFQAIINSAEIGVRKPTPEAYAYVLRAVDDDPATCLFVDDNEANVQGARQAGMEAVRYVDFPSFLDALTRLAL